MRKLVNGIGLTALVFFLALSFGGCASTGGGESAGGNVVAGDGETLVVVQRKSAFAGAAIKHLVFIDGEQKLALGNGASGKIVVPNGEHTIYTVIDRPGNTDPLSDKLDFTADGTELHFTTRSALNNAVLTED
jgi:hypothetical protein